MKILIINGPNLNLVGIREPNIYGSRTYEEIGNDVVMHAKKHKCAAEFWQSNHEGAIIDKIQGATYDALIINAGALSHYSYAIADALRAVGKPCIEVHLSNIYAREEFRSKSVISQFVDGIICGIGSKGYHLAIDAVVDITRSRVSRASPGSP